MISFLTSPFPTEKRGKEAAVTLFPQKQDLVEGWVPKCLLPSQLMLGYLRMNSG